MIRDKAPEKRKGEEAGRQDRTMTGAVDIKFAKARMSAEAMLARGREVVRREADALGLLVDCLDDNFIAACHAIEQTGRQLVITGMGKSGHIGRKVAATFAATGTPAIFIHPGEAGHGDLGMLAPGDVLLVLSNSGNTAELRAVLNYARKCGIPIIGVAARKNSLVIERAVIVKLLHSPAPPAKPWWKFW